MSPLQTACFSIVLGALTGLAGCGGGQADPAAVTPSAEQSAPQLAPTASESAIPTPPPDGLIADDGRTLWAPPTAGEPIDLSIVPDGSDLILHLRPKDLLAKDEGRLVWQALGPAGEQAITVVEAKASESLASIQSLVVGITSGESYEAVQTTLSIDPLPSDDLPLIQREIEQLLETSDADRHATLIFSPRFLLGSGGSMLQGPWEPLRDLLLAQTRDDWSAAAISLHLDDTGRLYWELRLLKSAAASETRVAKELSRQAVGWSDDVRSVVNAGSWSPYSEAIVKRSPAMLGVLGKYARRGVEGRQAVVNGYTPAGSAHQLVLAAERIVAELAAPPATALAQAAKGTDDLTVEERLQRPVTISFPRESLETAVAILSDTLGVPIQIVGRDLQLEGITRNQMLGLDVAETPAADALVEMLRRANPDPLAAGPKDPRQKLVYLVRDDSIAITTRSAAAKRGEPLPAVFQE